MSRIEKALENAMRRREPALVPERVKEPVQEPMQGPVQNSRQKPVRRQIPVAGTVHALKPSDPNIIGFSENTVSLAEEYRKLRSMILRLTKKAGNHNTIMVTSSECGEGKSLTSINLALVLAQEFNHTVLLVDADFRRPMLQTYLGLEPARGLSDCLADNLDVGSALMKTDIPTFSVLAAGRKTNNPAELLSSNTMRDLVRELKCRYRDRYIIIDTPPALPFAETHVISSYVDGTLLVVKEGSPVASVRAALDILKDGNVLGFVYNNAGPLGLPGSSFSYYRGYDLPQNTQTEKGEYKG